MTQNPQDKLKIEGLLNMTHFTQDFGIVDHPDIVAFELRFNPAALHCLCHIDHVREAVDHHEFEKKLLLFLVIDIDHR